MTRTKQARPRAGGRILAGATVAAVLVAGCGTTPGTQAQTSRKPAAASVPPTAAPPSPTGLDGCIDPAARRVQVPASSGAFEGRLLGPDRPVGVVLANMSPGITCQWLPFATTLVSWGYTVLVFDWPDSGDEEESVAAAAAVLSQHAHRLVAMGASQGAKAVIVAAANAPPRFDAVVSLSPETTLHGLDVGTYAAKLRVPFLVATAQTDHYGSHVAAPAFYRSAPTADKRLLVVPGTEHGTALVTGASALRVLPVVRAFLARYAPAAKT